MRERTHNLNHTAGGHSNAAEKKTLRHRGRDLQPARAVSWLAVAERLKGQKRLTDLCDELINKCHFFPSTWQTGYLEFLKTETILKKKIPSTNGVPFTWKQEAGKHLPPMLRAERVSMREGKDAGAPRRVRGAFMYFYPERKRGFLVCS